MPSDSLRSGYAVTAVFNGYIEGVLARLPSFGGPLEGVTGAKVFLDKLCVTGEVTGES